MLFFIGSVFLAIWVIGLALKVTVGLIHLALVVAIVLFIVGFFRGRTGKSAV